MAVEVVNDKGEVDFVDINCNLCNSEEGLRNLICKCGTFPPSF